MIQVLPHGAVLLIVEDARKRQPTRPVRHRVPSAESDFLRALLEQAQPEDRPALKRLFGRLCQLTIAQISGIQAWSNGKLRGKRRRYK